MQRLFVRFRKRLGIFAIVLTLFATAGAALAQGKIELFPFECSDDFRTLMSLNDVARLNLEFLADLYQTRGGDSEIAGVFNTVAARQAAAAQLEEVAQVLDAAYLSYEQCEIEQGATPTMYPMSREELALALAAVGEALVANPFEVEPLLATLEPLAGLERSGHGCLFANMDTIHQLLNSVAGELDMPLMAPGPGSCR